MLQALGKHVVQIRHVAPISDEERIPRDAADAFGGISPRNASTVDNLLFRVRVRPPRADLRLNVELALGQVGIAPLQLLLALLRPLQRLVQQPLRNERDARGDQNGAVDQGQPHPAEGLSLRRSVVILRQGLAQSGVQNFSDGGVREDGNPFVVVNFAQVSQYRQRLLEIIEHRYQKLDGIEEMAGEEIHVRPSKVGHHLGILAEELAIEQHARPDLVGRQRLERLGKHPPVVLGLEDAVHLLNGQQGGLHDVMRPEAVGAGAGPQREELGVVLLQVRVDATHGKEEQGPGLLPVPGPHPHLRELLESLGEGSEGWFDVAAEGRRRVRLSGHHLRPPVEVADGQVDDGHEHVVRQLGGDGAEDVEEVGAAEEEALDEVLAGHGDPAQALVPNVLHGHPVLRRHGIRGPQEGGQ
mmetsp:Transcript_29482/g.85798  ORF Transcript_29482/g.85798 Transcript_29482/m.85798 type:complete len:413 (-) Transcript_29482:75-1313(-)